MSVFVSDRKDGKPQFFPTAALNKTMTDRVRWDDDHLEDIIEGDEGEDSSYDDDDDNEALNDDNFLGIFHDAQQQIPEEADSNFLPNPSQDVWYVLGGIRCCNAARHFCFIRVYYVGCETNSVLRSCSLMSFNSRTLYTRQPHRILSSEDDFYPARMESLAGMQGVANFDNDDWMTDASDDTPASFGRAAAAAAAALHDTAFSTEGWRSHNWTSTADDDIGYVFLPATKHSPSVFVFCMPKNAVYSRFVFVRDFLCCRRYFVW